MDAHQEAKNTGDGSYEMEPFVHANRNRQLPTIQLTNTTATNLQHLIEDCLLKIFAVKSLTVMDLCSLSKTCQRIQQISQRVFPKDLEIINRENVCYDVSSRKYSRSQKRPSVDIETIFKTLGPSLSELSIYDSRHVEWTHSFLLDLVVEYCLDTLEMLKLSFMDILPVFIAKLKRLRVLELIECDVVCCWCQFVGFDSLVELTVEVVDNCDVILVNVFPKLERFTFKCYEDNQNHLLSANFLFRHPSLKLLDLSILTEDGESYKKFILGVIVDSCRGLEELSLELHEMTTSDLQRLQALPSLQILKLHDANCEYLKFAEALTHLRELHLNGCVLPKNSSQFAALVQLTKLQISPSDSGLIDVVGIVKRLVNLEELQISPGWQCEDKFILDELTLLKIVDVVKGRPNVLALKCKFDFVLNLKSCNEKNLKVRLMQCSLSNEVDLNDSVLNLIRSI